MLHGCGKISGGGQHGAALPSRGGMLRIVDRPFFATKTSLDRKHLSRGGKRFSAKKPHFPWRETDLQQILPPSRRTKAFFERFYRLPAAENRFSEIFFHFPPREGVFLRIYPISRRGKAFFGSFDRFPAAGRRLEDPVIGFAFHFGVSREQRSISCLRTTFLLQKHLAPIRGASNLLAFHAPLHC